MGSVIGDKSSVVRRKCTSSWGSPQGSKMLNQMRFVHSLLASVLLYPVQVCLDKVEGIPIDSSLWKRGGKSLAEARMIVGEYNSRIELGMGDFPESLADLKEVLRAFTVGESECKRETNRVHLHHKCEQNEVLLYEAERPIEEQLFAVHCKLAAGRSRTTDDVHVGMQLQLGQEC